MTPTLSGSIPHRVCQVRDRHFCAPLGLALLAFSALISDGAIAQHDHQAFFAEPLTGRKVTHYNVELPISRDQRQPFAIPDDCEAVIQSIDDGQYYRGSIVDRRLWQKVEHDCHYSEFLNRHPQRIVEDYVSDYDFMNARLSDMPIDQSCLNSGSGIGQTLCNPAATDTFGMLRYFPLAEALESPLADSDCKACRLDNGLFRGRLFIDDQGIRCVSDPEAPSLRLIAVDYSDINGDGFLDVILRFVPIGRGFHRAPMILPLTRFESSGPFSVPEPVPLSPPLPPAPPTHPDTSQWAIPSGTVAVRPTP